MKKQSLVQTENHTNQATVSFVRNLCSRITQALEEIDQICAEELDPMPQPSCLGELEGIGLFLYVKSYQHQMKQKYPAFTQNQILSILLTQWQQLPNDQKIKLCQKLNIGKLSGSKKLKKLSKMGDKLCQAIEMVQKSHQHNLQIKSQELSKNQPIKNKQDNADEQKQFFNQASKKKTQAHNNQVIAQQSSCADEIPQSHNVQPSLHEPTKQIHESNEQHNKQSQYAEQSHICIKAKEQECSQLQICQVSALDQNQNQFLPAQSHIQNQEAKFQSHMRNFQEYKGQGLENHQKLSRQNAQVTDNEALVAEQKCQNSGNQLCKIEKNVNQEQTPIFHASSDQSNEASRKQLQIVNKE